MASCDLLLNVSYGLWQMHWCLPDTAQADKRSPRTWYNTFLVDLIEYRSTFDKIRITTEGYDG